MQKKGGAPPAPPPAEVTVALPTIEPVIDYREYTGRTAAIDSVDIRARIGGYVEERNFREGAEVARGDLLFRIDSRPVKEEIRQAEANLAAQQAQLERIELDLKRARELIATSAISQADLDLAIANSSSGRAQLKALEAALARAKLNLDTPTSVHLSLAAPVGRWLLPATWWWLIPRCSPALSRWIRCLRTSMWMKVPPWITARASAAKEVDSARTSRIEISLGLANEQGFPHVGEIDFVDNVTDIGSGNITIRGRFANADGALLPGCLYAFACPLRVPTTHCWYLSPRWP